MHHRTFPSPSGLVFQKGAFCAFPPPSSWLQSSFPHHSSHRHRDSSYASGVCSGTPLGDVQNCSNDDRVSVGHHQSFNTLPLADDCKCTTASQSCLLLTVRAAMAAVSSNKFRILYQTIDHTAAVSRRSCNFLSPKLA